MMTPAMILPSLAEAHGAKEMRSVFRAALNSWLTDSRLWEPEDNFIAFVDEATPWLTSPVREIGSGTVIEPETVDVDLVAMVRRIMIRGFGADLVGIDWSTVRPEHITGESEA